MTRTKSICLGLLLMLSPMAANADPISFDISYSGVQFENTATATGTIVFDDAVLPVPGSLENVMAATLGVVDFSITVAGASGGNGTFGLADVTNWIWLVGAGLDLTADLVGQADFFDFNWCGFLFVGCVSPAPGGVSAFSIRADAEQGDMMSLVSMTPSVDVPEPGTLALLGLGLVGLAARRRKTV